MNPGARSTLLASYEKLFRAPTVSHSEVVELVRSRKLHGRGVGWIDVQLLASALIARTVLWTADPRLAIVSSELNVAYLGVYAFAVPATFESSSYSSDQSVDHPASRREGDARPEFG